MPRAEQVRQEAMLLSRRDERLTAQIRSSRSLPGVRAGSGVLAADGKLFVVQDDAFALAVVDPQTLAVRQLVLKGDGEALPKVQKPDFEAVVAGPEGSCFLLGSGSTPQRGWIAKVMPRQGVVTLNQRTDFYGALAAALGTTPNIEGAVAVENRLVMAHRGAGIGASGNALVELDLAALDGAPSGAMTVRWWDIGRWEGVSLSVTDLCRDFVGRVWFLAAAEATANAVDDGHVLASVCGVITPAEARWAPVLEPDGRICRHKLEGLAWADPRAYAVSDPDDPDGAAELVELGITNSSVP